MQPEWRSEVDRNEWAQGDKIVLATGASPLLPGIPGIDRKGVFSLRTLEDAVLLLEFHLGGPEVVILGGGLLGLEIARAILKRGLKQVTVGDQVTEEQSLLTLEVGQSQHGNSFTC